MRPRDRGREDEPDDDGPSLTDYPPQPRYVRGYRVPTRCTCGPLSDSPCDWCSTSEEDFR